MQPPDELFKLENHQEVLDYLQLNFRKFCDQFGEITSHGRKTPANGWRVTCEAVNTNSKFYGHFHTAFPDHLKMKAMNKERGLSVIAEIRYNTPYYNPSPIHNPRAVLHLRCTSANVGWTIKRRTNGSGYEEVKAKYESGTLNDLLIPDNLLKLAEQVEEYKEDSPDPFTFGGGDDFEIKPERDNTFSVLNTSQILGITVKGVVSLRSREIIMSPPDDPDETHKPFFFCDGYGRQGATFNLVTDGETFYPVTRVTGSVKKVKLRKDFGKSSISPADFNFIDKMVVQKAISVYVERTFGGRTTND